MLIVAINGSPQKEGNTVRLLREGLKVAEEKKIRTKWIHVSEVLEDVDVPFCNQCMVKCDGRCSEGNKLGEAFDLLREADAVLVGTPVYFGTVSAQLKGFWDKSRVLRREKSLLNTVGGVITVGGARFGGQETALNTVIHMMLIQGMTVIGDGYFEYDCGHYGSCAQKPSADDQFGLERARITVKRIIEVAEATQNLRRYY